VNLSDVAGYGHQVGQPPTDNRGLEKRYLESLISSSWWFDSITRNQIGSRSLLVRISPCHGDGTSSILVETAKHYSLIAQLVEQQTVDLSVRSIDTYKY
jgi:hypothetical protein